MLKAILIDCIPPNMTGEEADLRMTEAENLIKTYGGIVLMKTIQKKMIPNYETYIGKGKLEDILEENKTIQADILIINNELKPRQTYNVSEIIRKNLQPPESRHEKTEHILSSRQPQLAVWDRIDLILKIFQKHAETHESKLEIELAALKHMGPRIFGMGMELSRQGGGIGTRGVGETNTEFMRRHLRKFEQRINEQLESCRKTRKLHRDRRKRNNLKTVGIIGYTNAGKSSLLNRLTSKGAVAADKLFTTLDTRIGKMYISPSPTSHAGTYTPGQEILISDTIGFIRDLPPALIKSFQSTLEETIESDLLLHVIDISDPFIQDKIDTVNLILAQIDALHKPTIFVFNKTDLFSSTELKQIKTKLLKKYKSKSAQFISTFNSQGIDELKTIIAKNI